jgi:hypothetical protein
MAEAAVIPVELTIPADLEPEPVATEVAEALDGLCERLAIPGRVAVTTKPGAIAPRLEVDGRPLPPSWPADVPTSVDASTAERQRWRTWATILGSRWPGALVTEAAATAAWGELVTQRAMPSWFPSLMRATVSLGVPASVIAEVPAAYGDTPNPDVRVLAERVAARRDRWLRLVAAPTTLPSVIASTEPSEAGGRLDHALRTHLGSLRAVMPALTYAADPSLLEGTLAVWLGELTILECAVPPPGTCFLWSWAAWEGAVEGYRGQADAAAVHPGLWAWVDLDSPAAQALGGAPDDYLGYVTGTALMTAPDKLADLEAATTLLDALFQHVGAGHTVWFARAVLSDEHMLVALRAMLRDGAPITQFGAFLRELLVGLDLTAPEDGFAAALSWAQGKWRRKRTNAADAVGTRLRPAPDLLDALAAAAQGWDEWLPAEGVAAERLRDEVAALPPDEGLVVVPDQLRAFADAALRSEGSDLTVLGESDVPRHRVVPAPGVSSGSVRPGPSDD